MLKIGEFFFCYWNVFNYVLLLYLAGLSIYIFYGLRHSVEGQRQTEQEGYLPLEQLEGKGDQQKGIETPEPNN